METLNDDTANPTGFTTWLRRQDSQDSQIGDLARDYVEDERRNGGPVTTAELRCRVRGTAERAFETAMSQYRAVAVFE
jgi:hypothetical protein